MKKNIFIGIDPGAKGGVAAIDENGVIHLLTEMPTYILESKSKSKKGKTVKKPRIDPHALKNVIEGVAKGASAHATIEKVGAMPDQGVASSFVFGYGAGIVEGIVAGLGIKYQRTHPATWKKAMTKDMGKGKGVAIHAAKCLFPECAPLIEKKKGKDNDGLAEALLLAEYGRRAVSGQQLRGDTCPDFQAKPGENKEIPVPYSDGDESEEEAPCMSASMLGLINVGRAG